MKNLIISFLTALVLNSNCYAVDAVTGTTEDPKQADEGLTVKAKSKRQILEERRNALKAKHKAKLEARAAAAKTVPSGDTTQAMSDPLKDLKRDEKIREIKEATAPKK